MFTMPPVHELDLLWRLGLARRTSAWTTLSQWIGVLGVAVASSSNSQKSRPITGTETL